MKQLSRLKTFLMALGGIMLVVGACCFVAQVWREVMCWVYMVGAVLFATIQSMQLYEGRNLRVKRLKNIMNVADLLLILSGILMVDTCYQFLLPLFYKGGGNGYLTYIEYVYNKWVVLLLIAALLELYTTFRISGEMEQEKGSETPRKGV
ncbi:MAG: hypothetical protein K6C10_03760 [Prevotella sp.]|nr:hypothetical protein [Prevotella sp.]